MRDDIKLNPAAEALSDQLVEKLEKVYDSEIELDVYNLGLIYEISLDDQGHCHLVMTMTDTNCGCADTLPIDVADQLKQIDGIETASVEVTYSPVWKMTRISRLGRIALGISPRGGK